MIHKWMKQAALIMILAVFATALALAQERAAESGSTPDVQRVQGEILGMKMVRLKRTDARHLVLNVRTPMDDRVFVDLGPPTRALRKLDLRPHQNIRAYGNVGRYQGNRVMLANWVEIPAQKVDVRKPRRVRVQGTIAKVSQSKLRKSERVHTLVLVDTPKGKLAVDLGPREQAQKGDGLQAGQRLQAEGRLVKVQDKPFMLAYRYNTGGAQGQTTQGQTMMRARPSSERQQQNER